MSNTVEDGRAGELTLFCSGMTGSSIQNVSSTSMDGGSVSCKFSLWLSISLPPASLLGISRFVEVLTSTGMCLVPREPFRETQSIIFALDFLWKALEAFMPLGAMGKEGSCFVMRCICLEECLCFGNVGSPGVVSAALGVYIFHQWLR